MGAPMGAGLWIHWIGSDPLDWIGSVPRWGQRRLCRPSKGGPGGGAASRNGTHAPIIPLTLYTSVVIIFPC